MRDWRRAFAVLVLFLVTGVGIIFYLNQTPFQPRERDYAYVASFFAFSIWVGIGATGILRLAADQLKERLNPGAIQQTLSVAAGALFIAVPLLMMVVNYDDHDRSGRYVAGEDAVGAESDSGESIDKDTEEEDEGEDVADEDEDFGCQTWAQ